MNRGLPRRHSQYGVPSGAEIQRTATLARPEDRIQRFVEHVAVGGEWVDSRYGACIEFLGGRLEVPSGALVDRQGINHSLGWMEMLQLLAGVFDLDGLKRVAPNADHSLFTYEMAYGPRVIDNIPVIIESLRVDPNTRQAVLFVAKPTDGPTSNLPCTLTIQFLIRRGFINAVVFMRSWDLCRGLPYDLMMFSGLLEAVGRCLRIPAGTVTVQAGSAHIYLPWIDKYPRDARQGWRFTDEVPRDWIGLTIWAVHNMVNLEKGWRPQGIEIFDQ